MTAALEGRNVSFAYEPDQPVLESVSVHLSGGEFVGIVGPNGSGKSTLLRVLAGHAHPNAGEVLLGTRTLASVSRAERARTLAFLPQTVNPAFALSVFEVVCLGRYPHSGTLRALGLEDKEVAERCLHDTETAAFRDRAFSTLSGGERQRVLLASILAQEPELLLLDEPTSALDLHHEVDIFALLRRLAHKGYGVLTVTHSLNAAAQFCDQLLLLSDDAGVLAHGAPEEVLTASLLTQAYGAPIRVCEHPLTGTPLVTADATRETE